MLLLLLSLLSLFTPALSYYSSYETITASVGTSLSVSCHSMFVSPEWRWTSAKAAISNPDSEMILSLNGLEAHPNITMDRWRFVKRGFCHYKIVVDDIQHCDAGTFVCYGASNYTTYLNVVR